MMLVRSFLNVTIELFSFLFLSLSLSVITCYIQCCDVSNFSLCFSFPFPFSMPGGRSFVATLEIAVDSLPAENFEH